MRERKLLILGGKPIGSCELVRKAKELGHYVVVVDYLDATESPAKQIADESWNESTGDIESLKKLSSEAGINGVLAGVHEFNLQKMAELATELNLPCYCTKKQQLLFEDKSAFKSKCVFWSLDVAQEFGEDEAFCLDESSYPLAVKPRDGSGSRGFSKCATAEELPEAIANAKENSSCGEALIEEFIEADALIAHYTAHNGELFFSGLTDKYSKKMGNKGAPVMALQIAPSIHTEEYLQFVDNKIKEMLRSLGVEEGPIWIELFYCEGRFVVNEVGYRFGGSLTYHLVRELYGIDQLRLLIDHAMGKSTEVENYRDLISDEKYAIWPLHLKAGTITAINGLEWLKEQSEFVDFAQVHFIGEEIEDWGSAKQVFMYLHLKDKSISKLLSFMKEVLRNVEVIDEDGNNILFALFDPFGENDYPNFLREDLAAEQSS